MKINNENPNILFVFSDQHRWCDMGCYGNKTVKTPNFDNFSKKAIRFNNGISNSPLCVPARGSLLTGVLPMKHGAISNDLRIKSNVRSVAHILNDNGYHTGYIGKWHLGGVPRDRYIPQGDERLGFTEWKVCNCSHNYTASYYYDEDNNKFETDRYEPEVQTELACDFLRRNRDKTWALYLSWGPPHDPYHKVPQKYLDMYKDTDIELRQNFADTALKKYNNRIYDKKEVVEWIKGYYAHITALDDQFGLLVKTLEETGQMDNTIIVFTSDHGNMLGSQGYCDKQLPYEESVKVPLLVYWKGRNIVTATDEMIGLVDLPKSLIGWLGLDFPSDADGRDLSRLFYDPSAKGLQECYIFDYIPCHQAETENRTEWRGIRTTRYTFARTARDEGFCLYDNISDPFQLVNLINDENYQDVKAELLGRLNRLIEKHDILLPWKDFIRHYDLTAQWNESQAYFNLPTLD
ncbi:MAG: Arylsulfatase [Firmicutes bacterium ADurb.Bin193]|nr:MAG: Arylsulfatase [Firmicutes bacterium ADurb.Bin193]